MTLKQLAQAVEEFKAIYKEVFGVELNDEEATIKAQNLLQLFDCLTKGMEQRVK